jgi:hypothetical protein
MKLAPHLLLSLLPLLIACEKKAPSDEPVYGEPVGVTMEASKDLPGFEVAIAVSKGIAIDPLLPPIAGLLHKALKACPDFVKAAAANPEAATQVAFTVEQGKTKDATATMKGADCVASNLNAQELPNLTITPEAPAAPAQGAPGPAPGKLHVIAMLRFPGAPGTKAEGRKP